MTITIKTIAGAVLYESEAGTVREAVEEAAKLRGANLTRADLTDANLRAANLIDADLDGAKLSPDTIMPDGVLWSRYLSETVPALLTAGGKTLDEIREAGAWECHDWFNCPMRVAFGIDEAEQGPPLLIPRIREFIQLFDAGLIPAPWGGARIEETADDAG